MTEAEWPPPNNCNPAYPMDELRKMGLLNERQLRLFLCGCSRVRCPDSPDEPARRAWDVAERFADGLASDDEVAWAQRDIQDFYRELQTPLGTNDEFSWEMPPREGAAWIIRKAFWALGRYWQVQPNYEGSELFEHTELYSAVFPAFVAFSGDEDREAPEPMNVLREIVGNPFRPVAFSPAWHTDTVLAIAAQMYESRDFSAMPILADALQDAGCDSADVLEHCRGPGPHVRGCWVVDLVLGKE